MKKLIILFLTVGLFAVALTGCSGGVLNGNGSAQLINWNKQKVEHIAAVLGNKAGIKVTFAGNIPESTFSKSQVPGENGVCNGSGKNIKCESTVWGCVKFPGIVNHNRFNNCNIPFRFLDLSSGISNNVLYTKISYRHGLLMFLNDMHFTENFISPNHILAFYDPNGIFEKVAIRTAWPFGHNLAKTAVINSVKPFIINNIETGKSGAAALENRWNGRNGTKLYYKDNGGYFGLIDIFYYNDVYLSVPNSMINR
jgi:hypothetical protein